MTHITGPQEALKKITYRFAATRATRPALSPSLRLPFAPRAPIENTTAMVPKVTAMPIDPTIKSGLRPMRSTRNVATRQAAILTPPLTTLIRRACASVNPAACHSTAP